MDFIRSISFPNKPLISWTFLGHFCHHFWVGATAKQHQTHPKVMTKMVKKCSTLCSTDERFIRKRNTTYRIHTLAFYKILTFTVGNHFISVLFHHDLFVAKLRCAWNYEKTAEDFLLLLHLLYQFTREEVKEDRRTFMSELRL